jgi:Tfp pilus assembly protein FimT
MTRTQRGVSLIGLIFILFVLIVVALFAMKLVPSFLEYRSAKNAIEAVAAQNPASPADARRAFDARAMIDDINSVKAADLEVSRDGNQTVLGFAYRKEIQLFQGVGLYIDYAARAGGG